MSEQLMDEKAVDESSPSASTDGAKSDAIEQGDASQATQSATEKDVKAGETMESVINDAFKKSAASETSTEEGSEGGEVQSLNKTTEEEAEAVKEGVDDKKEEVVEDEKGPVPYERFHEVVKERDTLKQEGEAVKGKAKNYDSIERFCRQYDISPEQYNKALEVQALLNTNPAEALKHLLPIVEHLQGFVGNKLPDDLQKEVDAGDLTLTRAKEIAQFRAQSKFGERRTEHVTKQQAEERQAEFQRSLSEAAALWEKSHRTNDPDYKPKKDESQPDGRWEFVRDKFLAMLHATSVTQNGETVFLNPVRNSQDMTALLEKAYTAVSGTFKKLNGKPAATRRSLSSNGSSGNDKDGEPKTLAEAVNREARRHGIKV